MSEDAKEKMKQAWKTRVPISEETRNRMKLRSEKMWQTRERKMKKEQKEKISKTRILNKIGVGKTNSFYGKKHSEETINKMKNKVFNKETRDKISISAKNRIKRTGIINNGKRVKY